MWAILTDTFITGWSNTFTDDDGYPMTFDTQQQAIDYLNEHIEDLKQAVLDGYLEDAPEFEDYAIQYFKD